MLKMLNFLAVWIFFVSRIFIYLFLWFLDKGLTAILIFFAFFLVVMKINVSL